VDQKGMVLAAAERRAELVRLRGEGKSYREIGAIFNVSHVQAWRDAQRALAQHNREASKHAEAYIAQEWERLEWAAEKIRAKVEAGEPAAVEAWRRLSESRRKLRGLDEPERKELSGKGGEPFTMRIVEEVVTSADRDRAGEVAPGASLVPPE
jgi:NAD(P)-dependent dehydrogenase (short-subunit alcohol dehydrogenase family)